MLCMLTVDYFDILSIFVRVDVVGCIDTGWVMTQ